MAKHQDCTFMSRGYSARGCAVRVFSTLDCCILESETNYRLRTRPLIAICWVVRRSIMIKIRSNHAPQLTTCADNVASHEAPAANCIRWKDRV